MRNRGLNIILIKGLFGLDKGMLEATIGYKGDNFENYTNEELNQFVEISQEYENYLMTV